jgi:ribosomal protein S18 acetylase RimI-like enzyme
MSTQIRLLEEQDAAALFGLRRQALLDAPFAFLASPEDDRLSSAAAAREQLKNGAPDSVVFGAFQDQQLVGMLGLYRGDHVKTAHKINLWGMFVLPGSRGLHLGEQLLHAAIDYARTLPGAAVVHLGVSESAGSARRAYEKAGFRVWGIEPDAIRFQGRSASEHHMILELRSA